MNEILQKRIEEAVKKNACQQCVFNDGGTCNNDDDCKLFDNFVGLMTFALQNQWISVEEALPPFDEKLLTISVNVIVKNEYGKVTTAWYSYSHKIWHLCYGEIQGDDVIHSRITHWMLIPSLEGDEK